MAQGTDNPIDQLGKLIGWSILAAIVVVMVAAVFLIVV
jgi:hypothetical protein